ncbi:FAD binding domain-containing protein [Amycolatopsis rhabdoformis]|uniref:FAD binding domain-containing protein n=1 Tax=Amycolatopsis rhabdoformis TaxID=1448059 RepID=A0ABZ1IKH4_9PSEU|nr:FAD binding domain-containing protein [Amycolatopsis rhabdoformis]WSE34689.1 FAD binding domain-containing protein [Amycolatopsis rhabdoformis]
MKPADFTYHRPDTVAEVTDLLSRLDDAKVLGGGQSLLPIMNMRLASPSHLVDLTAIRALRQFSETESGIRYGATTTHMMIEDQLVPDVTRGLLPHAASGIGYRAIRNRGTVAGSLAHADSSAEWPTVMSAVDATVQAASIRGVRPIPVRELLQGFFTTALDEDEFIIGVDVPRFAPDTRWGLYKMARKPGEFAESLAVALVRTDGVELWLGAARDVPIRLPNVEQALHAAGALELSELAEAVGADTGREGHHRQLHAVTVQRALQAAHQEATRV